MAAVSYLLNVLRLCKKENKTLAGIARGNASATGEVYTGGVTCVCMDVSNLLDGIICAPVTVLWASVFCGT